MEKRPNEARALNVSSEWARSKVVDLATRDITFAVTIRLASTLLARIRAASRKRR
jgi:hypothetical protein